MSIRAYRRFMFRGSIARLLGLLLLSLALTVSLQAQSADSAIVHDHSDSAAVAAPDSTSSSLLTEENHVSDQAETQREPTLWEMLTRTKHLVMLLLMTVGIGVLFFVKVNRWIRLLGVVIIFFLFGSELVLPVHPSPMCGVTKLFMFRFTWGQWFVGFLALTLVIFIPSLIYRKAFCGWVCPLGAFQELINKIPLQRGASSRSASPPSIQSEWGCWRCSSSLFSTSKNQWMLWAVNLAILNCRSGKPTALTISTTRSTTSSTCIGVLEHSGSS